MLAPCSWQLGSLLGHGLSLDLGTGGLFPASESLDGFRRGDLLLTGANGFTTEPFLHKAPKSLREGI